ncbi:unnamed protein product [Amoebophrya sp. A120]|nr:unnamed protein product [Amoebophrya sp. A120]|eukprot:GSA120T00020033001.1
MLKSAAGGSSTSSASASIETTTASTSPVEVSHYAKHYPAVGNPQGAPIVWKETKFDYGFLVHSMARISKISNKFRALYEKVWNFSYRRTSALLLDVRKRLVELMQTSIRYWNPVKVQQFILAERNKNQNVQRRSDGQTSHPGRGEVLPVVSSHEPAEDAFLTHQAFGFLTTKGKTEEEKRRLEANTGDAAFEPWRKARRARNGVNLELNQCRGIKPFAPAATAGAGAAPPVTANDIAVSRPPLSTATSFYTRPLVTPACKRTRTELAASEQLNDEKARHNLLRSWDLWTASSDWHFLGSPLASFAEDNKDAVLVRVFDNIGTTNRIYVEIGVGSGHECNTRYWRTVRGWDGVMIDTLYDSPGIGLELHLVDEHNLVEILQNVGTTRQSTSGAATKLNAATTPSSILLDDSQTLGPRSSAPKIPQEFDLLSIDVDGRDWHFLRAILLAGYRPRVIIVERFNKFGIEQRRYAKTVEKNPAPIYQRGMAAALWIDSMGSSVLSCKDLAMAFGYDLVYWGSVDLVFVRRSSYKATPAMLFQGQEEVAELEAKETKAMKGSNGAGSTHASATATVSGSAPSSVLSSTSSSFCNSLQPISVDNTKHWIETIIQTSWNRPLSVLWQYELAVENTPTPVLYKITGGAPLDTPFEEVEAVLLSGGSKIPTHVPGTGAIHTTVLAEYGIFKNGTEGSSTSSSQGTTSSSAAEVDKTLHQLPSYPPDVPHRTFSVNGQTYLIRPRYYFVNDLKTLCLAYFDTVRVFRQRRPEKHTKRPCDFPFAVDERKPDAPADADRLWPAGTFFSPEELRSSAVVI